MNKKKKANKKERAPLKWINYEMYFAIASVHNHNFVCYSLEIHLVIRRRIFANRNSLRGILNVLIFLLYIIIYIINVDFFLACWNQCLDWNRYVNTFELTCLMFTLSWDGHPHAYTHTAPHNLVTTRTPESVNRQHKTTTQHKTAKQIKSIYWKKN